MKRICIIGLLSLAGVSILSAQQPQQPTKTPLVIVCSCEDLNARGFEAAVRDVLAASPRYYEVHADQTDKTEHYRLLLVAIDDADSSVAVSFVVLRGNYFMTTGVRVCGLNKMAWCANNILAAADHAIQSS